jgi:hypothetical protein
VYSRSDVPQRSTGAPCWHCTALHCGAHAYAHTAGSVLGVSGAQRPTHSVSGEGLLVVLLVPTVFFAVPRAGRTSRTTATTAPPKPYPKPCPPPNHALVDGPPPFHVSTHALTHSLAVAGVWVQRRGAAAGRGLLA